MQTLISLAVMALILVVAWLVTDWFAKAMYLRCPACGTMNAKRREQCRQCGETLRQ